MKPHDRFPEAARQRAAGFSADTCCLRRQLIAFLRLQGLQTLYVSQRDRPPFGRGVTWSRSNHLLAILSQYWQVNVSRKNTLKRVNAASGFIGIYSFKAITDGKGIVRDGELIISSYSVIIVARSRNTAFMLSCHDQSDNGK